MSYLISHLTELFSQSPNCHLELIKCTKMKLFINYLVKYLGIELVLVLPGSWVMLNFYGTSGHTDLKDAKWQPKQYHRSYWPATIRWIITI